MNDEWRKHLLIVYLTAVEPFSERRPEVKRAVWSILVAAALPVVITACAAGSGARLDRSREVLDSFRTGAVLPGYRYFTSGPGSTPDAILGIREGYTLRSDVWREAKMTPELLTRQVRQMENLFDAEETGLLGSYVINDRGEQVGIWYSAVGTTQVEMTGPMEIAVAPPNSLAINQLKTKLR